MSLICHISTVYQLFQRDWFEYHASCEYDPSRQQSSPIRRQFHGVFITRDGSGGQIKSKQSIENHHKNSINQPLITDIEYSLISSKTT